MHLDSKMFLNYQEHFFSRDTQIYYAFMELTGADLFRDKEIFINTVGGLLIENNSISATKSIN